MCLLSFLLMQLSIFLLFEFMLSQLMTFKCWLGGILIFINLFIIDMCLSLCVLIIIIRFIKGYLIYCIYNWYIFIVDITPHVLDITNTVLQNNVPFTADRWFGLLRDVHVKENIIHNNNVLKGCLRCCLLFGFTEELFCIWLQFLQCQMSSILVAFFFWILIFPVSVTIITFKWLRISSVFLSNLFFFCKFFC